MAAASDFCDKCFEAVRHDGEERGKWEDIPGGHKAYVAAPAAGQAKDGVAVLFCADIFGPQFINNRLIADSFADNGFLTYIPDYFNGDPVPIDLFQNPEKYPGLSMDAWRPRHGPVQTRPALDATIKHLRDSKSVTKIAAVGYCFGARYVVNLLVEQNPLIKVAALAHPSALKVPDDLHALYDKAADIPIVWLVCERDAQFPPASQQQADKVLGPLGGERYKKVYYADNDHGFAVKGDISKPQVKHAKEDSFKQTVEWFNQRL